MSSNLPKITHRDIRDWVGPASFSKGMNYFSNGAIFETRREGHTLKARCHGSQAPWYRVQATLGPEGIASADCSCPVGGDGGCKHIAALLLTWVDNPKAFKEPADLTAALEKRSKAELIALILQMIRREPDLEMLLELPVPGAETGEKPLDAEAIRRQAEHAFRDVGDEWEMGWGDPAEIADDLQPLVDLAAQYQAQSSPGNAATIYQVIAETILDHDEVIQDDETGHLGGSLQDCIEGLAECVEGISEPGQRESILKTLFEIYTWDVEAGGYDIGGSVPGYLVEKTTPAERQLICTWIQPISPDQRDWVRQAMGGLLLDLQAETLDDEAFLRICRQTGRVYDLVDRLLGLDRTDEAVGETRQVSDYGLLQLAEVFVRHGREPLAEDLVRDRAATSPDIHLTTWLKEQAKKKGDLNQALFYANKEFWQHPEVGTYTEVRQLAVALNQWPDLRTTILERLAREGKDPFLTEIYLEEDEIDRALEALERAKASARYGGMGTLQEMVAQAASSDRPKEAIRLYLQLAESLIELRGRDNYVLAAAHLRAVHDIYLRMGEPQAWQAAIANLRQQYHNLPALMDELNRAKL